MSQAPSVPPKQPGVDAVARLMGELHPKLQTKADFIVFAVHSAILAGGWKTFSEDGKESPALPESWNAGNGSYSFSYTYPAADGSANAREGQEQRVASLRATKMGAYLFLHFDDGSSGSAGGDPFSIKLNLAERVPDAIDLTKLTDLIAQEKKVTSSADLPSEVSAAIKAILDIAHAGLLLTIFPAASAPGGPGSGEDRPPLEIASAGAHNPFANVDPSRAPPNPLRPNVPHSPPQGLPPPRRNDKDDDDDDDRRRYEIDNPLRDPRFPSGMGRGRGGDDLSPFGPDALRVPGPGRGPDMLGGGSLVGPRQLERFGEDYFRGGGAGGGGGNVPGAGPGPMGPGGANPPRGLGRGARFDPYGPFPGMGRPNNDHMRKPGPGGFGPGRFM